MDKSPLPERADGPLIWVHVPDGCVQPPLDGVIERLQSNGGGPSVVFSGAAPDAIAHAPDAIFKLIQGWRPDVVLWCGLVDHPALVDRLGRLDVTLLLIDAVAPPGHRGRSRRLLRAAYGRFARLLAVDAFAAAELRRLGPALSPVEITGPITPQDRPLSCLESEREDFADAIGARPVWLAAAVPDEELVAVLAAHRRGLAVSHRLLLLLVPETAAQGDLWAERLTAEGWQIASRAADDRLEDGAEIYLADGQDELGLWYRLAPVVYFGGSLGPGCRRPPAEAARLGAAMIAGPMGGDHDVALDRFDEAGALRRIGRAEALGLAVTDLSAPDRAAALAHRAWDLATDGAEVEDRVASLLRSALSGHT